MTILAEHKLALKNATSDKVYHFQLVEVDGGFKVNAQNGKRGGKLTERTKTANPVTREAATKIFESLRKEKLSEGYSEVSTGEMFVGSVYEERFTGIVGQMLNMIDDPQLYIDDDNFFMQEKYDGQRRLKLHKDGVTVSINKKGLEVPTLAHVVAPLLELKKDFLVDGELLMGIDKYCIFDLLEYDGQCLRSMPAKGRYEKLVSLGLPNVVPAYFTREEKQKRFDELKALKKEGVVFKKISSPYVSGRPNSKGDQLKSKFYATDTFEVVGVTAGKRSVKIISYTAEGKKYDMGKVTIPENYEIPAVGAFIEVRYLYCYTDGKLFQTTYLGERNDQDKTDCHMREIKFKSKELAENDE